MMFIFLSLRPISPVICADFLIGKMTASDVLKLHRHRRRSKCRTVPCQYTRSAYLSPLG